MEVPRLVVPAGLVVGFLLAAGCRQDSSPAPAPAAAPPKVSVVRVRTGDVARHVELPAELAPWREVTLHARVGGYLRSWKTWPDGRSLDIGDEITAIEGDEGVLAVIDVPELEAEIARRQAEVAKAEADLRHVTADAEAAAAAVAEPRQERVSAEALVDKAAGAVKAAEADEAKARTDLDLARLVHDRYKRLVADKTVTDIEFDQVQARWQAAVSDSAAAARTAALREELKYARARLGEFDARIRSAQTRSSAAAAVESARAAKAVAAARLAEAETLAAFRFVRAPFPGKVVRRFVDVGALIAASSVGGPQVCPLLTLSDQSRLRVVVDVPEAEVRHLTAETPGALTLPDVPGFSARLKLSRAAGALRPDTRTQRIEMDLPNADGKLKAGLYGQVRLTMETRVGVVVLPAAAVGGKGGDRFVFLAVEGKAAKRPVEVGFTEGGLAEIRPAVTEGGKTVKGLSAGEAVIVPAAGQILQDGQVVEAAPTKY